jgi:hypothetical protein
MMTNTTTTSLFSRASNSNSISAVPFLDLLGSGSRGTKAPSQREQGKERATEIDRQAIDRAKSAVALRTMKLEQDDDDDNDLSSSSYVMVDEIRKLLMVSFLPFLLLTTVRLGSIRGRHSSLPPPAQPRFEGASPRRVPLGPRAIPAYSDLNDRSSIRLVSNSSVNKRPFDLDHGHGDDQNNMGYANYDSEDRSPAKKKPLVDLGIGRSTSPPSTNKRRIASGSKREESLSPNVTTRRSRRSYTISPTTSRKKKEVHGLPDLPDGAMLESDALPIEGLKLHLDQLRKLLSVDLVSKENQRVVKSGAFPRSPKMKNFMVSAIPCVLLSYWESYANGSL